jgi:hypothetical protein
MLVFSADRDVCDTANSNRATANYQTSRIPGFFRIYFKNTHNSQVSLEVENLIR